MKNSLAFKMLLILSLLGFGSALRAATCTDVTYSDMLLATNPEIGDACLKVIERDNVAFIKLKAKVVRQSVDSTIVQWQFRDGSWSESDYAYPASVATAEIGGKEVVISELAPKQAVNVYIAQRGNWMIADKDATEARPDVLPQTATRTPLFALLGGLSILLAGVISFVRQRG